MSRPTVSELHERIRQEHDELRALLGKVGRTIRQRSVSVDGVGQLIASLYDHVRSHFDDEELGGFFLEIVAQAPRLYQHSAAIQREHAWLLASMRALVEMAETPRNDDSWWQTLDRAVHDFGKDLMHHETKEHELLLDAYSDDIGTHD